MAPLNFIGWEMGPEDRKSLILGRRRFDSLTHREHSIR
jgi:hypothetical protein